MTWKRLAFALLLTVIVIPVSFLVAEAGLTQCYMHTDPHGDGQLGLSIVFGGAFTALMCGAATFVAVLFIRRQPR